MDLAEAGVIDADELSRRTRHILTVYRAKQRLPDSLCAAGQMSASGT
jgi:hypothetical protein